MSYPIHRNSGATVQYHPYHPFNSRPGHMIIPSAPLSPSTKLSFDSIQFSGEFSGQASGDTQKNTVKSSWQAVVATALLAILPTSVFSVPLRGASLNLEDKKAVVTQVGSPNSNKIKEPNKIKEVVARIQRAWDGKTYAEKDWSIIRVGLRVSDDTQVLELQPIRRTILQEGALNPDIPPELLHEAIYTAGILGKTTTDPALKHELAELVRPYTENIIVDYVDDDAKRQRIFVEPFSPVAWSQSNGAVRNDFTRIAQKALSKIGDPVVLSQLMASLATVGNSPERVKQYFDLLIDAPESIPLPELQEKVHKWVYEKRTDSSGFNILGLLQSIYKEPSKLESKTENKKDEKGPGSIQPSSQPSKTRAKGSGFSPKAHEVNTNIAVEKPSEEKPKNPIEGLTTPEFKLPDNQEVVAFLAKSILFLTKRGDKRTLPAIAQWFNGQKLEDAIKTDAEIKPPDLMVLQSLAILAKTDTQAFEVLLKVTASNPLLVGTVLFDGKGDEGLMDDTHRAVLSALKQKPGAVKQLIEKMASRTAPLIWETPTSVSDLEKEEGLRDLNRKMALYAMVNDKQRRFTDPLRKLASNPTNKDERAKALIGVALSRDAQSLEMLAQIGASPLQDPTARRFALMSMLKILQEPDMMEMRPLKRSHLIPSRLLLVPFHLGQIRLVQIKRVQSQVSLEQIKKPIKSVLFLIP